MRNARRFSGALACVAQQFHEGVEEILRTAQGQTCLAFVDMGDLTIVPYGAKLEKPNKPFAYFNAHGTGMNELLVHGAYERTMFLEGQP